MKSYNDAGCLRLVEAAIARCFVTPGDNDLSREARTRCSFARKGNLIPLWCAVTGRDHRAVRKAIIKHNSDLVQGRTPKDPGTLIKYLKQYADNSQTVEETPQEGL